ncbi:MAG: DNA polymerase III subunit gamma/tau [Cardiobacteriaceae bacterium]|nr:DNA polymerase III subunit gamma/tau [Cardiobacteriaceae bacterium]
MSYQVLARKWRPKNFQQLVGQAHVSQALSYALDQERLHHAYLFTGTRGVGKTTIARILAKSLNCERNGISSKPCGECNTCREIDEGRYPDLIEIDAASRTGVDDTRELMENVPYAPMKGRYKVYLIDEVHMFSKSSFNALLKTLEEPPAHVKFILATTDPQKLPITILSRCLQFHLKHLSEQEIVRHLAFVLNEEKIAFEPDALVQIARAGAGSMRDSLSLLDQSIAFGQGSVQGQMVSQLLGTIPSAHLYALLKALCRPNPKALRQELRALEALAPDYAHLVFQLLEMLQQITIAQLDAAHDEHEIPEPLKALSSQIPLELTQLWYQILSDTWQSLPYQPSAKLCVEMGLLRMMAFQPLYPQQDAARAEVVMEVNLSPEEPSQDLMVEQSALPEPMKEAVSMAEVGNCAENPSETWQAESKQELFHDVVNHLEAWLAFLGQQSALRSDLQSLLQNSLPRAYHDGVLDLAVSEASVMMWNDERSQSLAQALGLKSVRWRSEKDLWTPAQFQQQKEEEQRLHHRQAFMQDPQVQSALEWLDAQVEQIFEPNE